MPGAQIVSSRIANDSDCGIFCHDGQSGSTTEFHVRQTISNDGAVFVEHIPGYHVVYVAVGESIDQAIHDSRLTAPVHRPVSKAASRASTAVQRDRPLKPCNAFIMYRNHKIAQMRKENPEINQTDISREAAKWWHKESDEVKEVFKAKYREEKQVYDLKKCKRGRADSTAHDSESEAADNLSTPSSKRSRNDSLGLGQSAQRLTAKPRSRTMPNDMFGGSNARTSIVTDLRKQLAARSGAAFFDATQSPYDAHGMSHHAYPDFTSGAEVAQMPSLMHHQQMNIAPMVSYSPAAMPADYSHDYALPPVADYALPPVSDYAGDMTHISQPEYSHMTHSFVNRDEAARALDIAQKKWLAGDSVGALRIARKSHSLYPTTLSEKLIAEYEKTSSPPPQKGEEKEPESELRSRGKSATAKPKEEDTNTRTHTPQQLASVRAVISVKHDYYKVLDAERTATDAELKRAYRKSALLFHPDKNFAPGADEAFKLVAHAFTILSDPDKRAHYDRYGVADGSSGFSQQQPQQRRRAPATMFQDELSPEDLFNMFFGGDTGGRFGVQFGPNVRFAQHFQSPNHGRQQQREEDDSERTLWTACVQFVPLLFFVVAIFAFLLGGSVMPDYSFEMSPPYTELRHTYARNVKYWVDPAEYARSSLGAKTASSSHEVRSFERDVEAQYVSRLQRRCRQEKEHKRFSIHQAQGWFGIGNDRTKLQAAKDMPLPACDELKRFR
ncbi:Chaperone protein dnaJ [Coemansia sp. RSA 455]|nr:Chaperone protein dnaJ [Coemansia sp. RSA 455]